MTTLCAEFYFLKNRKFYFFEKSIFGKSKILTFLENQKFDFFVENFRIFFLKVSKIFFDVKKYFLNICFSI